MTGRDRVQFRDRKRTGQAVVALAADTIHAIYFDALSNLVETNPRNNVASLFFFLPFFLPPPSIPPSLLPQPSFPSNRSSREKLSHPSFSHRWTVFLARRKIPPPRKKERPRTESSPFPAFRNIQRLFVGIPVRFERGRSLPGV